MPNLYNFFINLLDKLPIYRCARCGRWVNADNIHAVQHSVAGNTNICTECADSLYGKRVQRA